MANKLDRLYNNIPQEVMRNANYRKYIAPFYYPDEKWIQVSTIYPAVNDYYWISDHGRVYSARFNAYLTTDLNQSRYNSIVLTCKNSNASMRISLQELFSRGFGRNIIIQEGSTTKRSRIREILYRTPYR